jgi:hypothetical protein
VPGATSDVIVAHRLPPLVSRRPQFHRSTTCVVHHLALSTVAGRSQSLLLLFVLPAARSALQWPPELPLRATVDHVPRCLTVRFAGPCRVTERRLDPEPSPREQSPKSSKAGATHHLFHSHLIDDLLIQPPSEPASTSMSFPLSPRSPLNPEPTTTTTERPPHRHSPTAKARHHGQPNLGEPLPSPATQIRPPTSPWCSPTRLLTASRRQPPESTAAAAIEPPWGQLPYFGCGLPAHGGSRPTKMG